MMHAYFGLLVALLYLPLAVLLVFSLNNSTSLSFPPRDFSLTWYAQLLEAPALHRAVVHSLFVALLSSTIATSLGTMVALLLARFSFRSKAALAGLAVLPLVVPYVVLGVALLILFRAAGVPLSLVTIAIGHAVLGLPFATLIVTSRLTGFDRDLEEAAMDLGASYPVTLRKVVLPIVLPAIVAAWLVTFTVSLDEVALAVFLSGREQTFPVYLLGQLRFAARLPVLIAGAVVLMLASLCVIALAERIRRRGLVAAT
jgi:spermidine/putrescine transport system permease protein